MAATLADLRAKPHFFVLAPDDFECGFTEAALEFLKESKRPYIVQKVPELDEFVLPAFPAEKVNVSVCLSKAKQRQSKTAEGTCTICKHLDCLLVPGGALKLANKIQEGYPQIFVFDPSKQLYAHVGHGGDLEDTFESWDEKLFTKPKGDEATKVSAQIASPSSSTPSTMIQTQKASTQTKQTQKDKMPEDIIGFHQDSSVVDRIDTQAFDTWKKTTGRVPSTWFG